MIHSLQKLLLVFLMLSLPSMAAAQPQCSPTPRISTTNYPGAASIPPSNNLLLPAGKSIESEGQKLIIQGRLLDKYCMPVPEAVVELWHANPYGKSGVASDASLVTPYPTFAGAGRTVTDSDGIFTFITAFPGINGRWVSKTRFVARAPRLNLRIIPPGMPDFSTVLFFENDRRNADDAVYKRLSLERRTGVTMQVIPQEEDLAGAIDIVLPGVARYRTY